MSTQKEGVDSVYKKVKGHVAQVCKQRMILLQLFAWENAYVPEIIAKTARVPKHLYGINIS